MSDNVITFPEPAGLFPKRRTIPVTSSEPEQEEANDGCWRVRPNMHTFLFRSRDLILESDEADLVRDVCLNVHRAETKLKRIRQRLQGVQEQAAEQVRLLTAADIKLTAAIVAALLLTRGGNANA
jgi:hypothetical protein